MKKVLFIDRDGTLIVEPSDTFQIDSLGKLEFLPAVFRSLYKIRKFLDYELVIVSNQDGMGSAAYPEAAYNEVQDKIITAFRNEGVEFDDVLIDRSMPGDNADTRKPKTGLLGKYLKGDYDLAHSWVVGDRVTDIELAKNLGANGILLGNDNLRYELVRLGLDKNCKLICDNWDVVTEFLALPERSCSVERKTKETLVSVNINLDGNGIARINSGIGFLDHMLEQIARHSGIDLSIEATGDLHVDEHHTIEDIAITLGEAVNKVLGNKAGLNRYGFALPMDDCEATVLLDFGGRPWLIWEATFNRERIGELPTEMFSHFFKSFSDSARCNLHIKAFGTNEHHKIEAIFKAFARAVKMAIRREPFLQRIPSSKESL
jgi:imidazoleglycerol-phosphate dehydratase / histidinol-phosphatase